jgi:polysaccharide chain length determinant protein (PEP-CTERM system associated)
MAMDAILTRDSNALAGATRQLRRSLRALVKWRWLALSVGVVGALASAFGIVLVKDRYEASARVFVDTQTVLKPLMAGLAHQPDADLQVRLLARTLISRNNVERLLATPDLGLDVATPEARELAITTLSDHIKIVPVSTGGGSNLFEIKYRGSNPDMAKRVVQATLALFIDSGEGQKKRDSEDAGRFIDQQIQDYESKLVTAENRLKEFKMRNFGFTGASSQDYFARVSVLTDDTNRLRVELSSAERAREAFRRELATEQPQLPVDVALRSGSPIVAELEVRLDAQKNVLDDLLRRYTDAHPDVASAKRLVAQLQNDLTQRRSSEEARLSAMGKAPQAATSPVYQKLRISLAEAEAQVAGLRTQLGAKQSQLDAFRNTATRAPQVEAELAQLNRDYDVIRKNYETMVARRESAQLGVKMDQSAQLAEFRLIEPPHAAAMPVFPGRLHAAVLGLVGAIVLGVLAALAADRVAPTIDSAATLRVISQRPLLGAVSRLTTPSAMRAARFKSLRYVSILGLLMAAQAAWVYWVATQSALV